MFKKIKKLKKAWNLVNAEETNELDFTTQGNEKAIFLSDGNEEDLDTFLQDQRGWTKFLTKHFKD